MLECPKHRFRPCGEVVTYDIWGQKVVKCDFMPTKQYMQYLQEKQKEEALKELRGLKAKLEYQQQTYGEVDKLDLDYFVYKSKEFYRLYKWGREAISLSPTFPW